MKLWRLHRGFTLVELMVSLAIMGLVLLASVPTLNDWTYSRQIKDAQSKLLGGYSLAKALAVRNPSGAQGSTPAAGIRVETSSSLHTVYVCQGDPTITTTCNSGVSSVVWQADFPASLTLKIGTSSTPSSNTTATGNTLTVAINNRGAPISSVNYYLLTRGGSSNDVSGPLL